MRTSPPAVQTVLRIDSTAVAAPKEVVDDLARAFAAISSGEIRLATFARHHDRMEARPLDLSIFREVKNVDLSLNLYFSISKLDLNLRQCDNTSPCPDNIPYKIFRRLSAEGHRFLLQLYNRI